MSLYQSLTGNQNKVKYDVTFKNLTCDTVSTNNYFIQKNIGALTIPASDGDYLVFSGGIGYLVDFPNGTTFTCPTDGIYEVNLNVLYDYTGGNTTINSLAFIINDGLAYLTETVYTQNNITLSILFELTIGDTLKVFLTNNDALDPLEISYGIMSIKKISN
jgi:hypothetical protein